MNVINEIFAQYRQEKDKLEVSVEDMKAEIQEFLERILLYGAGSAGIAFLYDLRKQGIEPLYFVDADPAKAGTDCEGLTVIPPEEISDRAGEDALVIVCINTDGKRYCKSFAEALRVGGHHGVYEKLRGCGCKNVIDYTYFRRCHGLFTDEKYNAPSCSDVWLMEEHEQEIADVYDLMEDALSQEVYEKIVRFRLLDDSIEVPTMGQEKQYFEYGFYDRRQDEVFVDCGAFNGISLKTFLKENNNMFEGYYGMEPDADNYAKLEEYIRTLPEDIQKKLYITPQAAWKDNGGITLYALHGPGSFAADIGKMQVESITIDDMLGQQRASYIKMNIEGSEKEALQGAAQVIRRCKPRLAIAGYHRTDDFWKIPLMIKSYREDYKIYLRSYMNHISFVFYAI